MLHMKTSDYYYELPEKLIAQTPLEPRDSSRLLVLDRNTGKMEHKIFRDVLDFLEPGDCLVLNDSRVLPARIYGIREGTGAKVEFLLLNHREGDIWEALAGPGKRAKPGNRFDFSGKMRGEVLEVLEGGNRLIRFEYTGNFYEILDEIGSMPLPHYITADLENKERYQNVYSREVGSAAAPTAGLHFTPELLERIRQKGVQIAFVTLHVGLGTFRPVKVQNIQDHKMHSEHYSISAETAQKIRETKSAGKRVIAVGTTSCRTLESASDPQGNISESSGWTDIFIHPGYTFKVLDGLITNFHLPESTLIMLVSAFAGYEHTMEAYKVAVEKEYRFFSFGDAMLIL